MPFLSCFGSDLPIRYRWMMVASRAGVSVQTVIRRFGGKEGLLAAAVDREASRVSGRRDEARTGDVAGAVKVLVAHYEELGDRVLKLLEKRTAFRGCERSPIEAVSTTGIGAPGCSLRPCWPQIY
jgi:AcrR family transcriptional regulator